MLVMSARTILALDLENSARLSVNRYLPIEPTETESE